MENLAYDERLENPKYEIIQGEEVMLAQPSINHTRIVGNLNYIISSYLHNKRGEVERCEVFWGIMVYFDKNNHYIPDFILVCDQNKIKENYIDGAPDLVVEVLSPSTGKRDIGIKKDVYEKSGVREYWIISPKEKAIEVYHLKDGKFILDDRYTVLEEWEEKAFTEKEKAEHRLTLKVSLYDDLEIDVKEIFENIV